MGFADLTVRSDAPTSHNVQNARYLVDRTESSELTLLKAKVKTLAKKYNRTWFSALFSPPSELSLGETTYEGRGWGGRAGQAGSASAAERKFMIKRGNAREN